MRFKVVILLGYIWIANAQILRIVPYGSKLRHRRFGDRLPTPLRPTIFPANNFPAEIEIKPRNQFRNSYRPVSRYPQVTTTTQPFTTEDPEITPIPTFSTYAETSLPSTPFPSEEPIYRPSASPFTFPAFSFSDLPSKTFASLSKPLPTFASSDASSDAIIQNPFATADATFSPSSLPLSYPSPTLPPRNFASTSRPLSNFSPFNYQNSPLRATYQRPLTYQARPTYAPIPVPVEPFPTSTLEPLTYSRPSATFAPIPVPVEGVTQRLLHRRPSQRIYDSEDYGPAYYSFRYSVNVPETGDFKEQEETRENDVVKGSYSVVQPDGRLRVVKYTADDQNGFRALVSYENVGPVSTPAGPPERYVTSRRF